MVTKIIMINSKKQIKYLGLTAIKDLLPVKINIIHHHYL